jgi:hypothetical protein
VLFRHVLGNAMIPILTGVVVVLPRLFMGSLIIESFFGIPGLGSYTIDAIRQSGFRHCPLHGLSGVAALHRRPGADRHFLHAGGPAREAGMIELGMIKPVLLWSDALILLLLVSIVVPLWLARRGAFNDTFRTPWRQVMASRMGRASALILAVYVSIGLLDSLHYVERLPQAENAVSGQPAQYGGEVLSLLDALLTPLRTRVEKTYSAPFATHLYAKETAGCGRARGSRLSETAAWRCTSDRPGTDHLAGYC